MVTRNEKWVLGAAWAAIAAAGALGVSKIRQVPDVEPAVVELERALDEARRRPAGRVPADDSVARWRRGEALLAEGRKAPPLAAVFVPEIVEKVNPRGTELVAVLPSPSAVTAAGDLDGVALRWSLVDAPLALKPYERRERSAPTGIRIERKDASGAFRTVATLDAKATAWRDAEAAPGRTWEYRVAVEGAGRRPSTPDRASAETPGHRRARLVGGDATVALVRVETYDRTAKGWSGREAPLRAGAELWPGGPRLERLWFAGFALKAALAWPDGRTTELDTKE